MKIGKLKLTELCQKDICRGCRYFEPVEYEGDSKLHYSCVNMPNRSHCAEEPLSFYVFAPNDIYQSNLKKHKDCIRFKKYKYEISKGRNILKKLEVLQLVDKIQTDLEKLKHLM